MGETDKTPPAASSGSSKKRWNGNNHRRRTQTKTPVQAVKFQGGKDDLDGNHFDCTGYGQSDRFMKTVQKIADYIGQEYKGGGITRTEVMTQTSVVIPLPTRSVSTSVSRDGATTITPPDAMDIRNYQSAKKIVD